MNSTRSVWARPWRRIAAILAIAMALLELFGTFAGTDVPIFTFVYAVLLLIGAVLSLRGHTSGLILVGLLFIPELVFVPFYDRSSVSDWVIQGSVGVMALIGLLSVGCALWDRRRRSVRGDSAPDSNGPRGT